jgi:hypothetical protein
VQLAIVHHHLNPGGVTRVIENQLRALAVADPATRPERVVLLHGGRSERWPRQALATDLPFACDELVVPAIDYDDPLASQAEGLPAQSHLWLADTVTSALTAAGCGPRETLVHWHNHSLGKNLGTPSAVAQLAAAGYRLLLQIHDFAEDFRPDNYRRLAEANAATGFPLDAWLYPQGAGIHYAVLNGRDRRILAEAGVTLERLHWLPNPAAPPPMASDQAAARKRAEQAWECAGVRHLVVYPVRGIRRKNLGEMLLWSAALRDTCVAVTLVPRNPVERASFDRWAELARELHLPCRLGRRAAVGANEPSVELTFGEALSASDALLTTSVAEGFGMGFLESWLARRPLVGRDLPEITTDFTATGLDLGGLYQRLEIPCHWFAGAAVVEELTRLIRGTFDAFRVTPPANLNAALGAKFAPPDPRHATVDFADLPTRFQEEIIRRTASSPADRQHLLELNSRLSLPVAADPRRLTQQAEVVKREYSVNALAERLSDTLQGVFNSPAVCGSPLARGELVLARFLEVDRFRPLRVEP